VSIRPGEGHIVRPQGDCVAHLLSVSGSVSGSVSTHPIRLHPRHPREKRSWLQPAVARRGGLLRASHRASVRMARRAKNRAFFACPTPGHPVHERIAKTRSRQEVFMPWPRGGSITSKDWIDERGTLRDRRVQKTAQQEPAWRFRLACRLRSVVRREEFNHGGHGAHEEIKVIGSGHGKRL
jgi:hypothetical protein